MTMAPERRRAWKGEGEKAGVSAALGFILQVKERNQQTDDDLQGDGQAWVFMLCPVSTHPWLQSECEMSPQAC